MLILLYSNVTLIQVGDGGNVCCRTRTYNTNNDGADIKHLVDFGADLMQPSKMPTKSHWMPNQDVEGIAGIVSAHVLSSNLAIHGIKKISVFIPEGLI